mmetsp:Transcript_50008/g.129087  ORF Transcript_50008/g.129087 Transcript_50008/m.129087 type:complete len:147 (+) Transcript_50008:264-704(+)
MPEPLLVKHGHWFKNEWPWQKEAQAKAFGPPLLRPFVGGFALCGHIAFLTSLLVLSSSWRKAKNYSVRQAPVLLCLLAYLGTGVWCGVPALKGTGTVFTILWLLQKELEFDANFGVKLLAGYFLLQYLYSNGGALEDMFDPRRLYD